MEVNELEIQKYHNPRIRRKVEVVGLIISIVIVAVGIFSLLFYGFYKEKLTEEIIASGKIALFFEIFFLEFIPQVFISSHLPLIVSLTSGMGGLDLIIISILSSLLSSILAFEIGRKYGWKFVCSLAEPKKIVKVVNFWNKYGKFYVLFSAISPLPYFPLVYGSLGMKRKKLWFFGIIPRIISFIVIGYLFI